ncbi:hypothetical protein EBT31_17835, partial [bacterium]|nr:hypothetical protein [bacterium]
MIDYPTNTTFTSNAVPISNYPTQFVFTMQDVLNDSISLAFSQPSAGSNSMSYHVEFPSATMSNQNYPLNAISHDVYPSPDKLYDTRIQYVYIDALSPSNIPTGNLWDILDTWTVQGASVPASDQHIILIQPRSLGFLWKPSEPHTMQTQFTVEDIKNHRLFYIPYESGAMSNESVQVRVAYQNTVSPLYPLAWKNYVSHIIQPVAIPRTVVGDTLRTLQDIPRSAGMIQDGVAWTSLCNVVMPRNTDYPLGVSTMLYQLSIFSDRVYSR